MSLLTPLPAFFLAELLEVASRPSSSRPESGWVVMVGVSVAQKQGDGKEAPPPALFLPCWDRLGVCVKKVEGNPMEFPGSGVR